MIKNEFTEDSFEDFNPQEYAEADIKSSQLQDYQKFMLEEEYKDKLKSKSTPKKSTPIKAIKKKKRKPLNLFKKKRKDSPRRREKRVRGVGRLLSPKMNFRASKKKRHQFAKLKASGLSNYEAQAVLNDYYQKKQAEIQRNRLLNSKLSPSVQRQLELVRKIQNKGKRDNERMQRQLREKKILGSAMSLLKTPYIFKDFEVDMTGVGSDNILKAKNIFQEKEDNLSILKPRARNILDTGSDNTLKF